MVKIKLTVIPHGIIVVAKGHADFDEYGRDIVCAGVSALTATYISCLEREKKKNKLPVLRIRTDDGYVRIIAKGFKDGAEGIALYAFSEYFLSGLRMIAEKYPANVLVTYENKF